MYHSLFIITASVLGPHTPIHWPHTVYIMTISTNESQIKVYFKVPSTMHGMN